MQHLYPSRLRRLLAGLAASAGLLVFAGSAAALAPGDPDPTFGDNGVAFYPLGAASRINAVALQPDGKIVVAGQATNANGHGAFMVARLNPDGSLDPTFGDQGTVVKEFGAGSSITSEATALVIQPDGQIVVGGDASDSSNRPLLLVARLSGINGSFDDSFGDHGKVLSEVIWGLTSLSAAVTTLALQPNGQIVAGGFGFDSDGPEMGLVTRLDTTGSFDSSFGDGDATVLFVPGMAGRHASWEVDALALQPDGGIVAGGIADDNGDSEALVARLAAPAGGLDPLFGSGGLVTFQPFAADEGRSSNVSALTLQPDGKIVAAGGAAGSAQPSSPLLVARLAGARGGFDPSFGSGGTVLKSLGAGASPFSSARAMVLQPDGSLVLGGAASDAHGNNQALVARLVGTNGSLDPSFGNSGTVLTQLGVGSSGSSEVDALALQPDGQIVAAGRAGSTAMVTRLIGQPAASSGGTGGGGGGGGADNVAPSTSVATLSKLGIIPTVFAAADSGPTISETVGAQVSYDDTAAVTTMFTVFKRSRGVLHKHRCMKPARGRIGKRCTRWPVVGRFTHADKVGLNSFHFSGRLHGRKLKPGRYRLRARPRFAGPTGQAVEVTFRIVS